MGAKSPCANTAACTPISLLEVSGHPSLPAVSIAAVIPAHGRAPTLAATIQSAIDQGPQLKEIILVDDGLDSDARGQLVRFTDQIGVCHGPGRGAGAARNVGIDAASAEWIALLDSDDLWMPGHVSAIRAAVAARPDVGACFGGALHTSDSGRVLVRFVPQRRHANLAGLLKRRLQPTVSATAISRAAVREVGGFFEEFEHPAGVQDIDLWWRVAQRYPCVVQPRPLVRYVVHQTRDRSRSRSELEKLARDRELCIERLKGRVSPFLLRRAAAQHHAVMARYWYMAGLARDGLRHARISLCWLPTLNGFAALAFGLAPAAAQRRLRTARHRVNEFITRTTTS